VVALLALIGRFSTRFQSAFEVGYGRVLNIYNKFTRFFAGHKVASFVIVGASTAMLVWLMGTTPSEMVPNEDTGTVFVMVNMPPGTSQERTGEVLEQVDQIMSKIPGISVRQMIDGYSFIAGQGATYGTFIVKLDSWEERGDNDVNKIIAQLYGATAAIKDGNVLIFAPPMISGYSMTNGFELKMQDKTGGDINQFFAVVQTFLAQLTAQPEIQVAYTTFNPTFPQYLVEVDAAKCIQAGINPQTILTTLQGYYGSMYVSNFNRFGKIYRVMMQANPESRINPETLNAIKIRNGNEMAPISNFMTLTRTYGPDLLNRFNLFTSMSVTGQPAPGFSSGDALAAIDRVAKESLPQGYT
ncbi:MAG: efflux RND transporter permease subunit, partial [Muribaculaceae bacterium]|nr:efflux RND transporter permease subunit [Muribaculaceae bacterium]